MTARRALLAPLALIALLSAAAASVERRAAVVRLRFDSSAAVRAGAAEVYGLVAASPGPVRRVELGQTTLEDMFLRAVQS